MVRVECRELTQAIRADLPIGGAANLTLWIIHRQNSQPLAALQPDQRGAHYAGQHGDVVQLMHHPLDPHPFHGFVRFNVHR